MLTPLLATTAILALFTLGARAQEPEPGRDAAKTIEFDDADVRDAIRAVLKGRSIDVVVADHVRGKVSTSVDPSEPAAALAKIAAALGTGFAKDEYGVLCVGGAPAVAAAEERMPLPDLVGLEIRAAMKSICDRERVPVAIGPDIDGMVMTKPDVSDWRRALRALAPKDVVLGERNGVVYVVRERVRGRSCPLLVFDDVPAATVLETIAMEGGAKVVVEKGLTGRVTLRTSAVPWRHALQIAAEAVRARVVHTADGTYRVMPGDPNEGFALVHEFLNAETAAEGLPLAQVAPLLSAATGREVTLAPEVLRAGRSVVVGGFRGSKQQFLDMFCTCLGLEAVESESGSIELRNVPADTSETSGSPDRTKRDR